MDVYSHKTYWSKLPEKYKAVIREIANQLSWTHLNSKNFDSEHWGGDIFWNYIYSYNKGAAEQQIFRRDIDILTGLKFETIKRVKDQGLKELNCEIAFCYSAYINEYYRKTPSHQFLLDFVDYTEKYKERSHLNLKKHKNVLDEIRQIKPYAYLSNINLVLTADAIAFDTIIANRIPFIPNTFENNTYRNPAALLKWSSNLTEFVGRKSELKKINSWWENDAPLISCACVIGKGGAGKTRLVKHFAETINKDDWTAGFINFSDLTSKTILQCGRKGILLLVDYPEEQLHSVTTLISQLPNLDTCGKKLRLILIARNRNFLDKINNKALHFIASSIYLEDFSNNYDECFELYEAAYLKLSDLKSEDETDYKAESVPNALKRNFEIWFDHSEQQTPLTIMLLAYYNVDNQSGDNKSNQTLNNHELIRYLTIREEEYIQKSILSFNECIRKTHDPDLKPISPRGTILVFAVAAIPQKLSFKNYVRFKADIDSETTIFSPPEIQQLKSLQILNDHELACIEPDILAADFLLYTLNKYAENELPKWIYCYLGMKQFHELRPEIIYSNFMRLGRLLNDVSLNSPNDNKNGLDNTLSDSLYDFKPFLIDNMDATNFIFDYISNTHISLAPLIIACCEARIEKKYYPLSKHTNFMESEARTLVKLAEHKYVRGDYHNALIHIKLALKSLNFSATEFPETYAPATANALFIEANILLGLEQYEDALGSILLGIKRYRRFKSEFVPADYYAYLSVALNVKARCLLKIGQEKLSLKESRKSVFYLELLMERSSASYISDLPESLQTLYFTLVANKRIKEAREVITRAVCILEQLNVIDPFRYRLILNECLSLSEQVC